MNGGPNLWSTAQNGRSMGVSYGSRSNSIWRGEPVLRCSPEFWRAALGNQGNEIYVLALPSSEQLIPVRFYLAADSGQGKVLWERGTQSLGVSSTPGMFFFNRKLPLDRRAQRTGQNSSQNQWNPIQLQWQNIYWMKIGIKHIPIPCIGVTLDSDPYILWGMAVRLSSHQKNSTREWSSVLPKFMH